MKILYCHNNYYIPASDGNIYSAGQFPYDYWSPYLEAFGSLRVIGRKASMPSESNLKKMNVSGGAGIEFCLFENINNLKIYFTKYKEIHARMKAEVEACDGVIIRAVSDLGWLAYKYAKAMNKPIAMEMSACPWDSTWNHGGIIGKLYAPLRYWRDKVITLNADYTIYVSHSFLPNRYPTKGQVEVASNVRISKPSNSVLDERIAHIKKQHGDDKKPIVVGLIGTLSHKLKGVDDALQAIASLSRAGDKIFIFRSLGPGDPAPYMKRAQQLGIADRVFFDGMIQSGSAVLQWLDQIDIYIQPSYQEGVPRATIEAMSRACPAIGSTAGGIPELLSPEFLHKPGDYKGLASLIMKLSNDPEMQIFEASKNFEKSANYTEKELVPKRIAFWKSFAEFTQKA